MAFFTTKNTTYLSSILRFSLFIAANACSVVSCCTDLFYWSIPLRMAVWGRNASGVVTKLVCKSHWKYNFVISFLTCHKILRHGDSGFTSSPKEGVLRIFALKNRLPQPCLNLLSNGRHANHYATKVTASYGRCIWFESQLVSLLFIQVLPEKYWDGTLK
jgi:hypothetical protein